MFQLRALIWKAYKVRLRRSLSSFLDLLAPISIILVYICIKWLLGAASSSQLERMTTIRGDIFRSGSNFEILDPRNQLRRHICTKVPIYLSAQESRLGDRISSECGIELVKVANQEELVQRLRSSLDGRVALQKPGSDLNRSPQTQDSASGCSSNSAGGGIFYDVGLAVERSTFDIYLADGLGFTEIYQSYSQSSSYNEFSTPQSDMNLGVHLLQLCLSKAISASSSLPPKQSPPLVESNTTEPKPNQATGDYKMRLRAFPITAAPLVTSLMFMMFVLFANLVNALVTIMRVSDDNENGFHHYVRAAGVSSATYWLSHYLVILFHMSLQNLVIAMLLAIPVNSKLLDPMYETNITIRWLMLLTYSMAIQSHAFFSGAFFQRASQAVMTTCLLAGMYCVYPLTWILQWNPYGFAQLAFIFDWPMVTPAPLFQVILYMMCGLYLQTGLPLQWSQLNVRIVGHGLTIYSLGSLWIMLLCQIVGYLLIVIVVDDLLYSAMSSPLATVANMINSLCCCNAFSLRYIEPANQSRSIKSITKDPNRICCSLRHFTVHTKTTLVAQTKGDPLKMTPDQLKMLHNLEERASKAHSFLVNRQRSPSNIVEVQRSKSRSEEPYLLDDNLEQHIVWLKSAIQLRDLNLDFRFNQISYVIGHTESKDLLFESILGLSGLKSGRMIIDGSVYMPSQMHLARSQIGYLSLRDVFVNEISVFDNLQLFGSLRDSSYKKYDSESQFILNLLHLATRKDLNPAALTHRSARKLALAVSAVGHTKLLLLVEPTMCLRWKPRCQVLNLLKKYKSIRSIVVDTSDIDEATAFGDRLIFLADGKAEMDAKPNKIESDFACGYWLLFELNQKGAPSDQAVQALDGPLSSMFGADKIGKLDVVERPTNELLINSRERSKEKSGKIHSTLARRKSNEPLQSIVILKLRNSLNSNEAISKLIQMSSQGQTIASFHLMEVNYQSIEDILVLKMSKAVYPDLPPDLLIALRHRTARGETDNSISVKEMHSISMLKPASSSIYRKNIPAVIIDRINNKLEFFLNLMSMFIAVLVTSLLLYELHRTLSPNKIGLPPSDLEVEQPHLDSLTSRPILYNSLAMRFYQNRAGLIFIDRSALSKSSSTVVVNDEVTRFWPVKRKFSGSLNPDAINSTDAYLVASILEDHKELPAYIVFVDGATNDVTLVFEPNIPHAALSALMQFQMYNAKRASEAGQTARQSAQHTFFHPWHEMIRGYHLRRLFYGGFICLCEPIALATFVLAPIRHREEFKGGKVRLHYWLAMAIVDACISLATIVCYVSVIVMLESISSPSLIVALLLTFVLYRLAMIPFVYIVSLTAPSAPVGWLFVWLFVSTMVYSLAIMLRTFVEWALLSAGYTYTLARWMLAIVPTNPLVDAISTVAQISRMNDLCDQVPAYTQTKNVVPIDGASNSNIIESLIGKVRECLANGKAGISTDVFNHRRFGILWDIYFITLFGLICWIFLVFSERFYGFFARRASSAKTTNETFNSMVRSVDSTRSIYNWDREKDRLVSEYIRCLNEARYIRIMRANCAFLRIWLKPMADQSSAARRVNNILEPLKTLGHSRTEVRIELKTTLQIFVRVGSENSKCPVGKEALIETYIKYTKSNPDTVLKFAVLDWTQESLYKILLHGHYNTKSQTSVI